MNSNSQRKLVWKVVLVTIRYLLVTVAAICAVTGSGELAYHLATQVRGIPSADVGVVVYEHPDRAISLWLFTFPSLSFLCLFIIKRTISRHSNLPYWVGAIVGVLCFPYYLYPLMW